MIDQGGEELVDRHRLDERQVARTATHYHEIVAAASGALTRMIALEAELLACHRDAAGSGQEASDEQDDEQGVADACGQGR